MLIYRMSCKLFFAKFACLLLLLFCCVCVYCANAQDERKNSILLFDSGGEKPEEPEVEEGENTVWSPFVVATDSAMVAFAVKGSSDSEGTTKIMVRHTKREEEDWEKSVTDGDRSKWTDVTELQREVENKSVGKKSISADGISFVAVGKENTIYLVVVEQIAESEDDESETKEHWKLELIKGHVGGSKEDKAVTWKTFPSESSSKLEQQFKDRSLRVVDQHNGFYGFLLENGEIMFVLKADNNTQDVSAIVYSKGAGSGEKPEWVLSYVGTAEDCYDNNSIFLWENKLIMVVHCDGDSTHKVRESNDMGWTWKDSDGQFAQLYGYLRGRGNFTTGTVNNRSVLLFTEQKKKDDGIKKYEEICLWMTDANRVHDVGVIATSTENFIASRLLHSNGELFHIHQTENETQNDVILTHLEGETNNIRSVLKKWNALYESVAQLCDTDGNSATHCATPMPTAGLVGFLSGDDDSSQITDAHALKTPEIKGGTKIKNGFKFKGPGAGARWSVGPQERKNGPNGLAESGMTFVASVNIDSLAGNGGTSLMGVGMSDMSRVGLRCTRDGRWALDGGEERTTILTNDKCEVNRTYQLALTLQDGSVAAYIDWEPLKGVDKKSMRMARLQSISHVYVGADSKDGEQSADEINMSVRNVLLYNRPFKKTEIDGLKKKNRPHTVAAEEGTQTAVASTSSAEAGLTPKYSRKDGLLLTTGGYAFKSASFCFVLLFLPVVLW